MKLSTRFTFVLTAALMLAVVSAARAQAIAADNAANYTNWVNGQNSGTGFFAWVLQDNNGSPAADDYAGQYIGSSGTAIDTNSRSFGLYANGADITPESVIYRGFSNALTTTTVFKVKFKNDSILSGQYAGFSLMPTTNAAATNSILGIAENACFNFYFQGGGADYLIWDGNGVNDTGIGWNENGMSFEFTPESSSTYHLVIKNASGSTVLYTSDAQPLMASGPVAGFVGFALNTGENGDVFFDDLEIDPVSAIASDILNILPVNGTIFMDPSTNGISFEVASPFNGVQTNKISLVINGVTNNSGLGFSGTLNDWHVTNNTPLQTDVAYTITINVTDVANNNSSQTFSFNTWFSNLQFIEAEDYNFHGGDFIPNPVIDEYGNVPVAVSNTIDVFLTTPPTSGTNAYRPQDYGIIDTEVCGDPLRPWYLAPSEIGNPDYDLSFIQFNEWENYTRTFSNVTCAVYARMASLSSDPTMLLERLASLTATTTNQPRNTLGTFVCPSYTGGGVQTYATVPLTDFFSNPVLLRLNGTNTLRTTCIGGGYNFNYLLFVPVTNIVTLRPYIASGFPYPGASGAAPDVNVSFQIANRTTSVTPSSIRLFLNGTEVTSSITLSNISSGTTVNYQVPGILPVGSTNTLLTIFSDGSVLQTNQWQFTVANLPVLSPSAALPLGYCTDRGFNIHVVKATNGAPSSLFPPSVATALAQLSGSIINTNTGLPYYNEAAGPFGDGYYSDSTILNFRGAGTSFGLVGPFTNNESQFPYITNQLAGSYTNEPEFFSASVVTYLQLTNGIYRFGVFSDDGFQLTLGANPSSTNLIMNYAGGRSVYDPSNPSVQDFVVEQAGLYPVCLLYYQATGDSALQFYSINRVTGQNIFINDPSNPAAVPAFQLTPLQMLNPERAAGVFSFSFQTQTAHTHVVQFQNTTGGAWQNLTTIRGTGAVTNVVDSSDNGASRFYRIETQ